MQNSTEKYEKKLTQKIINRWGALLYEKCVNCGIINTLKARIFQIPWKRIKNIQKIYR